MTRTTLTLWVALAAGCVADVVDDADLGLQEAPVTAGASYTLERKGSAKCIEVAGADTRDETAIVQGTCSAGRAQLFRVEDAGGGRVRLVDVHSGKCLDVRYSGTADGTPAILWGCNGSGAQAFTVEGESDGYAHLRSQHSSKCLDVAASSAADGARVQIYGCNGTSAQSFRFHYQGGARPPRQRVLETLREFAGRSTLAGQHNRFNTAPGQFTGQMHDVTGRYPALWSGDFLFEPEHIAARAQMVAQAQIEWSHGALVQLMYHACPPTQGEACNWEGGIKSRLSDAQWRDLVTDGGALNRVWKSRLDRIVPFLQQLEDAGVAPLFRPHHEMNQGVFWWAGRPGAGGTRRLYQITHDYLVYEKGLDNLIWVWDVQDLSWDFAEYNPGPGYYDIAALDVYGDGFTQAKYDAMLTAANGALVAIGECARLPTEGELARQPNWLFFMGWSELTFSDNSQAEIRALYGAPRVRTLDEMPGW